MKEIQDNRQYATCIWTPTNNSGTLGILHPCSGTNEVTKKSLVPKERLDVPDPPADTQFNVQAIGARWSLRMHRPTITRTTRAIRQHVAFQEGHCQT